MKKSESGFALLSAVALAGFSAIVIGLSYRLLNNRIEWMRIVRVEQRMDLLEAHIKNAARSFGAMRMTAAANPGSLLDRCLLGQGCISGSPMKAVHLKDGANNNLSGQFGLNGENCSANCPFDVQIEMEAHCDDETPSCSSPSEIITRYTITKVKDKITTRQFKAINGQVSLSTFSCPPDEYVHAITDDGQIQCSPAEASPYKDGCPDKTAAVGIDKEGFLSCSEITQYCTQSLGVAMVLDVSGSMLIGNKIHDARQVLKRMLKKFNISRDKSSLTTFSDSGFVLQGFGNDFGGMASRIDTTFAVGGTNMSAGLQKAAETLASYKNGPRLIVFVSDGFHNIGSASPVAAAQTIKDSGVRIMTIGFSKNADKNTLRRIASAPEDFFNADDAEQLNKAFGQISEVLCRN